MPGPGSDLLFLLLFDLQCLELFGRGMISREPLIVSRFLSGLERFWTSERSLVLSGKFKAEPVLTLPSVFR